MKITKLWSTEKINELTNKAVRLNQLNRVRQQIVVIHRHLTRVDVALDTLEGKAVDEAKECTTKMLKLLSEAKNAGSLMMVRVNMEMFKDRI